MKSHSVHGVERVGGYRRPWGLEEGLYRGGDAEVLLRVDLDGELLLAAFPGGPLQHEHLRIAVLRPLRY